MTTTIAPYRSELPVTRDGFAQLLRAELTKFRTVQAWVIALVVAGLLVVAFAWVSANGNHVSCNGSSQGCIPAPPVGPGGEPVADTFSFLHQPLVGNGILTAQVTSLSGEIVSGPFGYSSNGQLHASTHSGVVAWAKAGILVKDNTSQGSAYAAVMVTGSHGVRMQYNFTHDVAGFPGAVSASTPRWLRLTRAGDLITGYESLDGTHWTKIGTARLAGLTDTVQAGLFVTSPIDYPPGSNNSSPSLATATFDQVHSTGGFPNQSWTDQVIGATGADTGDYPALPAGASWFQQSAGRFTISGSGDIAPQVAGSILGGGGDSNSLLAGGAIGLIVLIVLAALFITSEYRRGLIRTTLTAHPRRGQVLAAKVVVIGSVAFVAGSVATAIGEVVSRHVLSASGNYVFPLSSTAELRVILGTGLLFALAAVLVLALGAIMRRSAGAVITGIVLFVLPFILGSTLSSGASDWLFRITPSAAFAIQSTVPHFAQVANSYSLANGYYPLGPWAGLAVLCAYTAAALGAATWLIRRRDA